MSKKDPPGIKRQPPWALRELQGDAQAFWCGLLSPVQDAALSYVPQMPSAIWDHLHISMDTTMLMSMLFLSLTFHGNVSNCLFSFIPLINHLI